MAIEKEDQIKNAGQQVTDGSSAAVTGMTDKMGAGANNALANSSVQQETPGMQKGALDNGKQERNDATESGSVSSQSLADSETRVGEGAVTGEEGHQKNQEADPADMKTKAGNPTPLTEIAADKDDKKDRSLAGKEDQKDGQPNQEKQLDPAKYGGNFSNSTQDIYNDPERQQNQDSSAGRGEFGSQDTGGTHGGYGNQYREPETRGNFYPDGQDRRYGGNYGPNGYHPEQVGNDDNDQNRGPHVGSDYDYGYQGAVVPTSPLTAGQYDNQRPNPPAAYNAQSPNQLNNTILPNENQAGFSNDNGSPQGKAGYSNDYGNSSGGSNAAQQRGNELNSQPATDQRNQGEDARSSRGGYDNQGERGPENSPARNDQQAQEEAPGDNSRDASFRNDDGDQPKDDRSGYGDGDGNYGGSSKQGYGSKGGSYNDEYSSSDPNSKQGSSDRGDLRSQERNEQNYGEERREQYRNPESDEAADYGSSPRRNLGRDNEQDASNQ